MSLLKIVHCMDRYRTADMILGYEKVLILKPSICRGSSPSMSLQYLSEVLV